MAKPPLPLIVQWRDLAQEGLFYTDIAKDYPDYTVSQIRRYCVGDFGADAPGPIKRRRRCSGNPWLQGERSAHALLNERQVRRVLDDWDEEEGWWRHAAGHWANLLKVATSTILKVRCGITWKHLKHPNAGRKKRIRAAGPPAWGLVLRTFDS